MRAYSYDLRQRILRAVDQGTPRAEICKTFAVSQSTIKRYLTLRRKTGDVKPKTIPGRLHQRKGLRCTLDCSRNSKRTLMRRLPSIASSGKPRMASGSVLRR
ncbi:MAG TPA: helix-turn-helix domain-containing protein [Ktedonobacteraceae bacterium]|nr:helix-turn-helix domain-containing protein [Ktedonobacteraceae bacterium]